ncbi:MAG: hypothetical protein ACR2PR_02895 [Pseudohongiellaceae bacterium]
MKQKTVRYKMQWDRETYHLAERAAQASELSNSTKLTNEQFDAFCHACENPPPLSAKIRKAAQALDREGFATAD